MTQILDGSDGTAFPGYPLVTQLLASDLLLFYRSAAPGPIGTVSGAVGSLPTGAGFLAQANNLSDVASASAAFQNLSYSPAFTGALARNPVAKLGDSVSAKDFGCVGNGNVLNANADTQGLQAAILWCAASGQALYIPAGTYVINAALPLVAATVQITGAGKGLTILKALGSFLAVVTVATTVTRLKLADLTIAQAGTTTQCLNIALNNVGGSFPLDITDVEFTGDGNNTAMPLVYSGGILTQYLRCHWAPNFAGMTALQIDGFNANSSVLGCSILGVGAGIDLTKSSGATLAPQGVRIQDCVIASFSGAFNIRINSPADNTWIGGCVCDQSSTCSIYLGAGVTDTTITNGYCGLTAPGAGQAVICDPSVDGLQFINMQVYGGTVNFLVEGFVSLRASSLFLYGNFWSGASGATIQADSVNGLVMIGNIDSNSVESLTTSATNPAGGSYTSCSNNWSPAACTLHATSSYRTDGCDRGGLKLDNGGVATPGSSATSIVVTHGLSLTPRQFTIAPQGNVGNWWLSAINASTFTINWATAGVQSFSWRAQVYQ